MRGPLARPGVKLLCRLAFPVTNVGRLFPRSQITKEVETPEVTEIASSFPFEILPCAPFAGHPDRGGRLQRRGKMKQDSVWAPNPQWRDQGQKITFIQ